ncbi:hypothetical protein MKW94_016339 [Papaver nudicaule]|uniref:BAH domain-containing protein n=1 Tax=Papaver nudicaule TaxID=74823 RepID=A0AA41VM56_PAPNU|nr:hypothetical protein [Papaver nudicaule]
MSWDAEEETDNKLDFKWGKLKGKSQNNVELYESFTFDGVEYFLYDCVYLRPPDDSEAHYIGKIVKIMKHPSGRKNLKIVWFFRPSEIPNWLRVRDITYPVHEIFLASGKGVGIGNVNPVEAIVGKCNVVCTSEDKRNPQPSKKELRMADFVFSRTFDVHEYTFSDQLDDNISGIEVEHFFNNKETQKVDKIKAPIVQTKEKAKLKPVEGGEVVGNAVGVRKPRMRCKDAATVHIRHDQPVDVDRTKTNPKLAQGTNMQLDFQCMKTDVTAKESFQPANRRILSSTSLDKATKFKDKEVAPKPVLKKFTTADTYYLKMKKSLNTTEPRKDFARHDKGIFSPVIPSKRPAKFSDREVAAGFTQEKRRADIQPLIMKKKDLIERREKVHAKDLGGHYSGISTTVNLSDLATSLPYDEAPEASRLKKMFSSDSLTSETQQKADVDRSKWFESLTWEQRMDHACEKGTLVRLQNLDPSYTSAEIENIMWTYLKVKCIAKVLQQSTFSSPHNGQALLIFEKEAQAEMVISELRNRCLLLPNGRPLIAQRGVSRVLPDKSAKLIGHLILDGINKRREQTEAVSTSHHTQPDNLEYEQALDWIVMQKRSEAQWRALYKGHGKELAALKAELKQ